jgi:hypothetical protein
MKKITSFLSFKQITYWRKRFVAAPERYWHIAILTLGIILLAILSFDAYTFFGLAQGPGNLPEPEVRTQQLHMAQFQAVLQRLDDKQALFASPVQNEDAVGIFVRPAQ